MATYAQITALSIEIVDISGRSKSLLLDTSRQKSLTDLFGNSSAASSSKEGKREDEGLSSQLTSNAGDTVDDDGAIDPVPENDEESTLSSSQP